MAMLESLKNSLRLPNLRNRLLFTILMLAVLRLGAHIPVPGVDPVKISKVLDQGGLLGLIDMFSGGAFKQMAIFAMSVTPYINSSIIIQLLTVVIPKLEEMQKEGEEGRKKIQQYTRYGTVILGIIQAFGFAVTLRGQEVYLHPGAASIIVVMISLTAGTAFLMWLGEMITEKGIGNGISLIIFAGIVSRLPSGINAIWTMYRVNSINIFTLALIVIAAVVMTLLVVLITEGVRKVPVEYARRVVGNRTTGGQKTFMPIRVNQAGMIPIIFANSLLYLPITIATYVPASGFARFANTWLSGQGSYGWVFYVLNFVLIVFFTYFYTAVTFNPTEVADNLKKNGGFIPGYRPGKPTADYIARVSDRLTLIGSLYLAGLTTLPILVTKSANLSSSAFMTGSALLIVVGTALDTMTQIESQLVMRHYQGFMRS